MPEEASPQPWWSILVPLVIAILSVGLALIWFLTAQHPEPLIAALGAVTGLTSGAFAIRRRAVAVGIAAILIALVAAGLAIYLQNQKPVEVNLTVRVADQQAAPVANAKLLVFYPGGPQSVPSDNNGVANFAVPVQSARLFVEKEGFQIYDETLSLSQARAVDVRLTAQDNNNRSVIVRAVDDRDGKPINGASVVLISGGETYTQATDSNGLAKFTLAFDEAVLEADISVSTAEYAINQQRVSLQPDQVQDMRLNLTSQQIVVTGVATPLLPVTVPPGENMLIYGQNVSGSISRAGETDIYHFIGSAGDSVLIKIGKEGEGELWPKIRLLDPASKELSSAFASGVTEILETLTVEGQFIIFVEDGFSGLNTGDYNLSLQKVN